MKAREEKVPTQSEIEQQRQDAIIDAFHGEAIRADELRTQLIEQKRKEDAENERRCGVSRRMFDKGLALADVMETAFQKAGFERSYGGDYCNDEVCEWRLGEHGVTLELARTRGSNWSCGSLTGDCKLVTHVDYKRQSYGMSDASVEKVITRIKEIVRAKQVRAKEAKEGASAVAVAKEKIDALLLARFGSKPAGNSYENKVGTHLMEQEWSKYTRQAITDYVKVHVYLPSKAVNLSISIPDMVVYSMSVVTEPKVSLEDAITEIQQEVK